MHVVAWRDCAICARLLVDAGADSAAVDWYGKTPLALAGENAKAAILVKPLTRNGDAGVDTWKTLRAPCVMKPSEVHLANIERCTRTYKALRGPYKPLKVRPSRAP